MTSAQIRDALETLVQREFNRDLPDPKSLLTDNFESMELMTLAVAIEDTFHIFLDPEDEVQMQTSLDLVRVIERKTKNGNT